MHRDLWGNNWYKVGLHIHTTLSDGKKTPEEAAAIYRQAGYDAIAITDHWNYYPEDSLEGLKIISGCEYNLGASDTMVDVMHIVGVGMKRDISFPDRTPSRQTVIDEINRAGGKAIMAHPAWSLNTAQEIEALHGVAMVEIYNAVSDAHESCRPYSGYIVDLLANDGCIYPLVATDDTHYYDGTDETKAYVMVKAKSLASEDILDAIIRGDSYASQGPDLYVKREGDRIIVDCSECEKICFMSNAAFARNRTFRGERLTHAEYAVKDFEKWVRVEVCDRFGNYAWSNIIVL